MNALRFSLPRHSKNYKATVEFYRDGLGMQISEDKKD
jgi:hypothetical protein